MLAALSAGMGPMRSAAASPPSQGTGGNDRDPAPDVRVGRSGDGAGDDPGCSAGQREGDGLGQELDADMSAASAEGGAAQSRAGAPGR
jgi:hypothetical protein